jgi:glycosyltransferase involved in cell wall biosynthesis
MRPPPSPALRVLMTADAVGGVFCYATGLARVIAQRGGCVHLVIMGPPPRPEQLEPLSLIDGVTIEVTDLALEWLDPEAHDLPRAAQRLAASAERFAPDVVHLNGYREAQVEFRAPVLVAAHSCVPSWWRACRGTAPQEPRWHIYAANANAGLAKAQVWTAPTAAHREIVALTYAPQSHGVVIHNGIDPIGDEPKRAVILAAGRLWDEAKNIGALTYAARHLPWPVRVAGAITPPHATNVSFRASGLATLGELSRQNLQREMRRAAIFVSPALYEPFGLAVLEAATAGCALVLADLPSFRELWAGAALFVNPRQPDEIYAALDRLCRDHELRRLFQNAALRRSHRYSLEAMTDAYLAAYACTRRLPPHRAPWPEVAA